MAGLGSGHQYWTNGSSKILQKTITREDRCRQSFQVEKYGFSRKFNPITGAVDQDILTYPPCSGSISDLSDAADDKKEEYAILQRQRQCKFL